MADIYVVFFKTDTTMGKTIRFFTRNVFNHVSVSLNSDLNNLYSFARVRKCAPLVGGFVNETPSRYLISAEDVKIKVCRVNISDEYFAELCERLSLYRNNSSEYIYNSFSAVGSLFGKDVKIANAYTCVEFVADILKLNGIKTIKQLENILKNDIIYSGCYTDYLKMQGVHSCINFNDIYFDRMGAIKICTSTVKHFYSLVKRI